MCLMRKECSGKEISRKKRTVGDASSLVDAEDSGELDRVAAMRVASCAQA